MAGMGKRLRPHTLTTPKPLVSVAGKPIVQRLVEDIAEVCSTQIEEIAFVISPKFGAEVEKMLVGVAEKLGAKGVIAYQEEALGTAHAVMCAKEQLNGPTIVAFADTLFQADFTLDSEKDGIIWVKEIEDPSQFGVVKLNEQGEIVEYVEKPSTPVSNLAMIGIYYFKNGEALRDECQYLIDNGMMKGGEYQLPDAFRALTEKGASFVPGKVRDWMDCGNKNITVQTNARVLDILSEKGRLQEPASLKQEDAVIIQPCYFGENVTIKGSVIGPHVSVGDGTVIEGSVIQNAIVQENTTVSDTVMKDSMVGSFVTLEGTSNVLSVGDYNELKV